MDNKLKIINYLGKQFGKRFTMLGLSKIIGIPYASFHRTVQHMNDVLESERIGKSKTLSLKVNNPILTAYLTISSDEEKKDFLKTQQIIKKIAIELNTSDIV